LLENRKIKYKDSTYSISEIGLKLIERDIGTGYHQPHGIIIWYGSSAPKISDRKVVDSRSFAPTILEALGVNPREYMKPSLFQSSLN